MQENLQRLEDTQTTIRALLLSAKNGLTLRQLENDYSELEGERIPWKDLGYSSLLSFLQNMPSVVQITNKNNTLILNGIASNKSKHVHKLVSGQKQQKFESVRRKFRPSSYFPRTAPMRIRLPATVLSKVIALVKKHPNGINKHEVFQIIQLSMPFCQISIEDMEAQLSELSHKLYLAGNKIYFVCSKVDDHDDISHKSKSILHKQQRKISPIMMPAGSEDFSHTIDCDKIDLESRPSTNVSLPMFTKPTTSVKPMSNTISKCTEQESGKTWPTCNDEESLSDLFCYDSLKANQIGNEFNDNGLNEEEYLTTNKGVEILINERVKMRLQNLIQNHPNGIWCADLPQKYLDEYKVPLNYLDLGFNSMRDFASHLPEIFHCFQPHDGGDFILFSAKREIPLGEIPKKQKITNLASFRYTYTRSDEEPFPTDLSHNTCKELIPDEVMAIGDCVQHIKITDLVQSEKLYIEVVVVEVFTPSFFWVQLYDKQKMFNQFMEDLHYFYISKHMQYGIPSVVLEEGLNCACIYNGLWHRGIIKAVKPDQQVTVMFYDYGTLKTYPSDAVYYLHKMFSYLPSQAIPCGLVNIRPCIGSKWSCSTTHHFALRTADIPLIAMIASVNTDDNSMMITLTDTSQEEDIHINDWLVEQKHAQHGKMVCMKKRNFPFSYYLKCRERFKAVLEVLQASKNHAALYDLNPVKEFKEKSDTLVSSDNTDKNTFKEIQKKVESSDRSRSNEKNILDGERKNNEHNVERKCYKRSQLLYENLQRIMHKLSRNSVSEYKQNSNNTDCKDIESSKQNNHNTDCATLNSLSKQVFANETQNNHCRDLENYEDIPKEYNTPFDIQDPEMAEGELYTKLLTNNCNKNNKEDYVNSSNFWDTVIENNTAKLKEKESKTSLKNVFNSWDNLPMAETCFLNAVYNSSFYAKHDEDIRWSPSGNIGVLSDVSPSILRDIERDSKTFNNNNVRFCLSQEVLEMLTDQKCSEEACTSTESINKMTPQDIDNLDPRFDNNSKNPESVELNIMDEMRNDLFYMKLLSPKKELLKKLLLADDLSCASLDSDDKSTSSCDRDTTEDSGKKLEESEDNGGKCGYNSLHNSLWDFDDKCLSNCIRADILVSCDHDDNKDKETKMQESEEDRNMSTCDSANNSSWDFDDGCRSDRVKTEAAVLCDNDNSEGEESKLEDSKDDGSKCEYNLPWDFGDEHFSDCSKADTTVLCDSTNTKDKKKKVGESEGDGSLYEYNSSHSSSLDSDNDRLPNTIKTVAKVSSQKSNNSVIHNEASSENEMVLQECSISSKAAEETDSTHDLNSVRDSLLSKQLILNKNAEPTEDIIDVSQIPKETTDTNLVSIKESMLCNTVAERNPIPVFDDNDLESDDEPWDVQVVPSDLLDLLKIDCVPNKDAKEFRRSEKSDCRLIIKDVDDSSLSNSKDTNETVYQAIELNTDSERCDSSLKIDADGFDLVNLENREVFKNTDDNSFGGTQSAETSDDYVYVQFQEAENLQKHSSNSEQLEAQNGLQNSDAYECPSTNSQPAFHQIRTVLPQNFQGRARSLVEMLNALKLA